MRDIILNKDCKLLKQIVLFVYYICTTAWNSNHNSNAALY